MRSTPDLCDAYGDGLAVLEPGYLDFGGRAQFEGLCVTVKCFEDNSQVKALANTPGDGRVMVVDGGGSMRCALLGDMIATAAFHHGWAGFVIHGCVRDVEVLATLAIGVRALAAHPVKTDKRGLGDVDVPVTFAGVTIHPGDYLVADANGILVSPVNLRA